MTTYLLRTEVIRLAQQPRSEQDPVLKLRFLSRTESNEGLGPVETSPWVSLSLESAISLRRALDEATQGLGATGGPAPSSRSA